MLPNKIWVRIAYLIEDPLVFLLHLNQLYIQRVIMLPPPCRLVFTSKFLFFLLEFFYCNVALLYPNQTLKVWVWFEALLVFSFTYGSLGFFSFLARFRSLFKFLIELRLNWEWERERESWKRGEEWNEPCWRVSSPLAFALWIPKPLGPWNYLIYPLFTCTPPFWTSQ